MQSITHFITASLLSVAALAALDAGLAALDAALAAPDGLPSALHPPESAESEFSNKLSLVLLYSIPEVEFEIVCLNEA